MKRERMWQGVVGFVAAFGFAQTAGAVTATVPANVNVQGVLRDGVGGLESGAFQFTINIYSAAAGGTSLWTETQSSVPVESGFFTLTLSESDAHVSIADVVENHASPLYVGVTLQGDSAELPRIPLNSVPYAFVADHATTVDNFGGIDSTHIGNLFGSNGTANKCSATTFATGIDSNGNVTCGTPAGAVYTSTTSSGITVSAGASPTLALSPCPIGQVPTSTVASGGWTCAAPGALYTAAAGANAGIVVTTGASPTIGLASCAAKGQVDQWNGSAWVCAEPVQSGTGIAVDSTTSPPTLNGTYTNGNGLSLSATSPPTFSVNAPQCANGQGLEWSGSAFTCAAHYQAGTNISINTTTTPATISAAAYSNGSGLSLSSGAFSINATTCASGQGLVYSSATGFSCVNNYQAGNAITIDTSTSPAKINGAYTAGSGITITAASIAAKVDGTVIIENASNQITAGTALNNLATTTQSCTGATPLASSIASGTLGCSALPVDSTTITTNASNKLTAAPVLNTIATNTCAGGTFITHIAADGTLTCAGAGSTATSGDNATIAVSGTGVASIKSPVTNPITINTGTGSLAVGTSTAAPAGAVDFGSATGTKLPVTTNVVAANNTTVYAACGAGKYTVLGGGCSNTAGNSVRSSCPATGSGACFVAGTQTPPSQQAAGAAGWSCVFSAAGASNTAYAICLTGF